MLATAISFSPSGQTKQSSTHLRQAPSRQKATMPVAVSGSPKATPTASNPSENLRPQGGTRSQWVLIVVALVTAGFVGWQAFETRRAANATAGSVAAITTQSRIMERQAKASEDSVGAARDNAIVANQSIEILVAKERARLKIEPEKLSLEAGPLRVDGVSYTIFCYGTTPAFIESSWATVSVTESEQPSKVSFETPMSLKPVITPNYDGIKKETLIFQKPEGQLLGPINSGKLFVHFFGSITYKDVFGRPHGIRFRYLWRVIDIKNFDGTQFGYWMKVGIPEENLET